MKLFVGVWLLLAACGRIGFERGAGTDAPAISEDGQPADAAPGDGNASGCVYLTSCMLGEVTCCTSMNMSTTRMCIPSGQPCSGEIAECDLSTGQGCPVGWPCCQTAMDPAARCYDPQQPVPC